MELRRYGRFIGILKSCNKGFPKGWLTQELANQQAVVTAEVQGHNLIGVGWKDKGVKHFISTCGVTTPGVPHTKYWSTWVSHDRTEKMEWKVRYIPALCCVSKPLGATVQIGTGVL